MLDGGIYFRINILLISSQVVIEFGAKEFKHNCAAPFKVNGNNRTLITTFKTSELQ